MARVFEVVETNVKRWRVTLSDEYVERCRTKYPRWTGRKWPGVGELAIDLVEYPCSDDTTVELIAAETTCQSAELTEEAEHAPDVQAD